MLFQETQPYFSQSLLIIALNCENLISNSICYKVSLFVMQSLFIHGLDL